MGDLLDTILDIGDMYARYGAKGCVLFTLAVVAMVGAVVVLALAFG